MEVKIDGKHLAIEDVVMVARKNAKVVLDKKVEGQVAGGRRVIEDLIKKGTAIYGVTTGIGEFAKIRISEEQSSELQRRIIYSHAAGTGDPQPIPVIRAAMLLRANVLAQGRSGVRMVALEKLIDMLNKGVTPVVFEKGSVGTSGDLSPLAQMAEVVIGEGEAYYKGKRMKGAQAMAEAGIKPLELTYKEGLGLINGSQVVTGETSLYLKDCENLLKNSFIASAMSLDALKCVEKAYDKRVHDARPYNGQRVAAANLRKLIAGSEIIAEKSGKVQDGYSMRCTPQILSPSIDAYLYAKEQILVEMNSACDNPLFFAEDNEYFAAGNFHGQPVAMAADFLGIAMAELASLSERHANRLLNPVLSGLPDFLVEGKGLNSGLMVAQYTAAALVSENKVLAHPGVVDSISVSADQEDHVSMAPVSVRTLKEIVKNVGTVLAIEMMCAAQAMDFRKPLKPGKGTKVAYDIIRGVVPHLEDDRVLYPDIAKIDALVKDGTLVAAVEQEVGELKLKVE